MKKIKWIVLCLIFIVQLCGCSLFSRNADGESVIGSSSDEPTTAEETASEEIETVADTTETVETEPSSSEEAPAGPLVANSVEKEYLLKVLWRKMLQCLDVDAPNVEADTDWNRTYEAEAHLKNFTLDTYKYVIRLGYPKTRMSAFVYFWPDYITDVRAVYKEANERLQCVLARQTGYSDYTSWIKEAREDWELHVHGQVINVPYAQADRFIEGIKPYTAYEMWGSVLEVAGNLYDQNNGTILGNLSGKAVMTDFDFETVTGTYWICLTGEEPVQVVLDFVNQGCGVYKWETISGSVFKEAEVESSWLGIEFDLCTTQTVK